MKEDCAVPKSQSKKFPCPKDDAKAVDMLRIVPVAEVVIPSPDVDIKPAPVTAPLNVPVVPEMLPAVKEPVVAIFVDPNAPTVKMPVLMFEALRFGILAVASTPVFRSVAEPLVATAAKPVIAATPTELAGRLTVPDAVKLLVERALATVRLLSNWTEPPETWNFAEGVLVPIPMLPDPLIIILSVKVSAALVVKARSAPT